MNFRLIGFFVFNVVVSVSCINTAKKQPQGKGKLRFTELSYNFGELKHGDVVGHRFKVINDGAYPVVIQKVKKGCGCTDVVFPKKPIEAKDSAYVEVVFDTKGWNGRQVKQVVVHANDSIKKHELLIWASIK
ncbi:DUF1573 domain-containing protein [Carboxylicivirga sp. RSCT41]|uniref:DUF1573 domain-containing protein n=1 Tax=Carboxylicivirga agarovorans TaxID=3417570 RepID=UPI003D350DD4